MIEVPYRRLKTIMFSISVLIATVMVIALILGILFFTYSNYVQNEKEITTSGKFITIVITILIPSIIIAINLQEYTPTEVEDALIVVVLYWFLIPLCNSIIYCYTIGLNFIDAFFESISGFSGTGLTILSRVEEVPYTMLIWRATTQWIGELSVVVLSGAVLPHVHRILSRVYIAERGIRFAPTILSTTRRMLSTYIIFTVLGTILLMYSGMSLLDALAHSMTGIATGGMSTSSESITHWYKLYGSLVLIVSAIVMVIGSLNFLDLYNLVRGRFREFVKGLEVKWFAYIVLVFGLITLAITSIIFSNNYKSIEIALYNMISGLTTTGFQIGDINMYPDSLKIILILAMAVGGATFSTAGGIKIRRIAIALKSILWTIAKPFLPEKAYIAKRVSGEIITEEDIVAVYGFIALYIIIAIMSSILLSITLDIHNYSWSKNYIDALFETISALSCVGLSVGVTSIYMPLETKILLMTIMYLGRLEFLPIYIVTGYVYRRKITL